SYSFYRDARLRRLTRYRYNNVPPDYGGRYIYVRDNESGDFWSPSWQPTRTELDDYTCRHGMGYTVIGSTRDGIEAETRYFVPLDQNLEIWQFRVTNHRDAPADLSIFSVIEFALWDAWDDATNFQRNLNIGQVEIEDEVIYHKTEYRERRNHFAYFACSEPLAGFDTQREDFLGPYRGWDNPAVVERGASADSVALGWSPIGSHHVKLALAPGESREVIFILGYHENPDDRKFDPPDSQRVNKTTVKPIIAKYLHKDVVDAAFAALADYWDEILGVYQVETPDEDTNRMVNVWNAYQCMVTFNMSRSASFFESGIGRGLGFRDSNQDLLGFVHQVPERARQRTLDLAATQLKNGGAYHQYQPLTKRGNDAVGSGFNDDPAWLILGVAAYVKETGDWSILDEKVPYENQPGTEQPLYEHLQRSYQYTLDRLGPHGLPLIGRADWNDCLNLNIFSEEPGQSFQVAPLKKDGTVAESVFIAGLFCLAARELADMAEIRGSEDEAAEYRSAAAEMEETVWQAGWDGAWFRRAYDAFSDPIGSKSCEEGKIFIEPQGICTMAGMGLEDGRAKQALDAVEAWLATEHGIVLQQPAYSRYYVRLGEISSYPPGFKENASVFCHTNPWIMIAETMIGRGDQAFDYYKRINPSAREEISELHRCEPYVYAQTIAGKDTPKHGEAKNSWLTGTAAWNYVAITQWILGIRPAYDGLEIAPVIPSGWRGFKATRVFRGVSYHITVERTGEGPGISLVVDGESVEGTVVPLPEGTKDVEVKVELG
ncbi:MAG: GH36-type glycosyl hydrolase domain-containing protein, partial [Anaerolineae bacterium]